MCGCRTCFCSTTSHRFFLLFFFCLVRHIISLCVGVGHVFAARPLTDFFVLFVWCDTRTHSHIISLCVYVSVGFGASQALVCVLICVLLCVLIYTPLYMRAYIGGDVADVLGAFEAWGAVCRHSEGRPWLQSGLLYRWMYTL